ncbi:MAG: hypothetical protein ACRDHE_10585, partial [Ktedonobacterales bacterium]
LRRLAGVLLDLPLPNGWDTDPTVSGRLFGLPLRPWFQELRPLGGLLVVALAATLLLLSTRFAPATRSSSWIRQKSYIKVPEPLPTSRT